MKDLFKK